MKLQITWAAYDLSTVASFEVEYECIIGDSPNEKITQPINKADVETTNDGRCKATITITRCHSVNFRMRAVSTEGLKSPWSEQNIARLGESRKLAGTDVAYFTDFKILTTNIILSNNATLTIQFGKNPLPIDDKKPVSCRLKDSFNNIVSLNATVKKFSGDGMEIMFDVSSGNVKTNNQYHVILGQSGVMARSSNTIVFTSSDGGSAAAAANAGEIYEQVAVLQHDLSEFQQESITKAFEIEEEIQAEFPRVREKLVLFDKTVATDYHSTAKFDYVARYKEIKKSLDALKEEYQKTVEKKLTIFHRKARSFHKVTEANKKSFEKSLCHLGDKIRKKKDFFTEYLETFPGDSVRLPENQDRVSIFLTMFHSEWEQMVKAYDIVVDRFAFADDKMQKLSTLVENLNSRKPRDFNDSKEIDMSLHAIFIGTINTIERLMIEFKDHHQSIHKFSNQMNSHEAWLIRRLTFLEGLGGPRIQNNKNLFSTIIKRLGR